MKQIKHIFAVIACIAFSLTAMAQAPAGINYQAVARSSSGVVMANKTLGVRISILAGSASGSADYVERHSVSTNQFGLFNIVVGGGTAQSGTFSQINWGGGSKFIKLEIDTLNGTNYTTLSSTQMMSVPYALYAEKSGSGGGGLTGSGTSNYISKFTSSTALGNSLLYDNGNNLGLGTTNPNSTYKFHATSSNNVTGFFENTLGSNAAIAIQGLYTNSGQFDAIGVAGKSKPQESFGVGGSFEGGWIGSLGQVLNAQDSAYIGSYGRVTAAAGSTGVNIGVRGIVNGAMGVNYGGHFISYGDTNAIGVIGQTIATYRRTLPNIYSRSNPGGYFTSNDGQAVYSNAYGSFTSSGGNKQCNAIVGYANDANGFFNEGISAIGTGGSNTCTGINARGVIGASSTNYIIGVLGSASGSATVGEYAGYFSGDVNITGNLAKASGTFKIDHPQDPANKYLIHSFVESPDMMNIYNGNAVTDANGEVTVSLPDYFMAENKDFRYQLTVIGSFAQAMVAQEVADNKFVIKTNQPNVKVSWQVTGIRQDAWANAHRIVPVVEKKGIEKGKYLHPELFGQPSDMSISSLIQNPIAPILTNNIPVIDLSKYDTSKTLLKK